MSRFEVLSPSLGLAAVLILNSGSPLSAEGSPAPAPPPSTVSQNLLAALSDGVERDFVEETLERNPAIAAARSRALAATERTARARILPDPTASATAFVLPPETRVGPQRLNLALAQKLPWAGKRDLAWRIAHAGAEALGAEIEALCLRSVAEVRRRLVEVAFLDEQEEILGRKREHLLQHEQAARSRYSTGQGLSQEVVKLQAEITRVDSERLGIAARRATLVAELNRWRDRPGSVLLKRVVLEPPTAPGALREPGPEGLGELRALARRLRPEIATAIHGIRRTESATLLAEKGKRPDFNVGLTYTLVENRDDPVGRATPPSGNGRDVLGVMGAINLPLRRGRIAAEVAEATALERTARERLRETENAIEGELSELTARIPLDHRRWTLLRDVLILQAEESLTSARAAYITGRISGLDYLDAAHVLFDAYVASARARADYATSLVRLESAVGMPLAEMEARISDPWMQASGQGGQKNE